MSLGTIRDTIAAAWQSMPLELVSEICDYYMPTVRYNGTRIYHVRERRCGAPSAYDLQYGRMILPKLYTSEEADALNDDKHFYDFTVDGKEMKAWTLGDDDRARWQNPSYPRFDELNLSRGSPGTSCDLKTCVRAWPGILSIRWDDRYWTIDYADEHYHKFELMFQAPDFRAFIVQPESDMMIMYLMYLGSDTCYSYRIPCRGYDNELQIQMRAFLIWQPEEHPPLSLQDACFRPHKYDTLVARVDIE